jgi:hypothetical protein
MAFEIPPLDHELDRAVVIDEHPAYPALAKQARFLHSAFSGTGGFAPDLTFYTPADVPTSKAAFDSWFNKSPVFNDTYLEPNIREGRKFERRLRRSWYENLIRPALQKIAGFLLKIPPDSSKLPPLTQKWLESVSRTGISWDRWMETELIPWALTYGKVTAILDRPSSGAVSRWQQQQASADKLTVGIIHPESIWHWNQSADGRYRWFKYVDTFDSEDNSPLQLGHLQIRRYRVVSDEGWYYVDEEVGPEADQPGKLKVNARGLWKQDAAGAAQADKLFGMPVAIWQVGSNGESMISEAAQAARARFNHTSCRDNLLRDTAFPTLTGPSQLNDTGDDNAPVVIGTGNYLEYPPDLTAEPPHWISPDSGPFETYAAVIETVGTAIERMLGLDVRQAGTSGVAKSFDVMELTRLLKDISVDMAEGEHHALTIAAAMHDEELDPEARRGWSTEFDAVDVERLVTNIRDLVGLKPGPTATRLLLQRAVLANLPDVSTADRKAIIDELKQDAQGAGADVLPDGVGDDDDPAEELDEGGRPIEVPDARAR